MLQCRSAKTGLWSLCSWTTDCVDTFGSYHFKDSEKSRRIRWRPPVSMRCTYPRTHSWRILKSVRWSNWNTARHLTLNTFKIIRSLRGFTMVAQAQICLGIESTAHTFGIALVSSLGEIRTFTYNEVSDPSGFSLSQGEVFSCPWWPSDLWLSIGV